MALPKKRPKKRKVKIKPQPEVNFSVIKGHRKDNPNLTKTPVPTKAGYVFDRYKRYNKIKLGDNEYDVKGAFEYEGRQTLELMREAGIIKSYEADGKLVEFNDKLFDVLGFSKYAELIGANPKDYEFSMYVKGKSLNISFRSKNVELTGGSDPNFGEFAISLDLKNLANKDDNPFLEAVLEVLVLPQNVRGKGAGLETFATMLKGLKRIAQAKGKDGVNVGLLADIESGYWTWLRYGVVVNGGRDIMKSERGRLFSRYLSALSKEFNVDKKEISDFIKKEIDYVDDFINEFFYKGKGIWFEFVMLDTLQQKFGLSEEQAQRKYKEIFLKYAIDYVGFFRFFNNDTPDTNYSLGMLSDIYRLKFNKDLQI